LHSAASPMTRLSLVLALVALAACNRPSSSGPGGAPSASAAPAGSVDPFDAANDAAEPSVALARDRGVAKGEAQIRLTAFSQRVNRADELLRQKPDAARSDELSRAHHDMIAAFHAVESSDEETFEAARRRFHGAGKKLDRLLNDLGVPAAP
jgi:hypothetical protein